MKPHRRDSYQPRLSGDHSKKWVRGGVGSIVDGSFLGGDREESRLRMVWRGKLGSQLSIQVAVGSNPTDGEDILAVAAA